MTTPLKGVRKSKVSGFCGSRMLKEKFDISVDSKNGKIILIDTTNQSMKLTGINAGDLNFFDLKIAIKDYQDALKNNTGAKKPTEIDDPSINGEFQYYARLNAEDHNTKKPLPKILYIYARDLTEIIKYSNTLLFGSYKKEDREILDPKHKDLTTQAITRHKIFLAEMFYKRMYQRCKNSFPRTPEPEEILPTPIVAQHEPEKREPIRQTAP